MVGYCLLGFAVGVLFGLMQYRLMYGLLNLQGRRRYLRLFLKLALWGGAMALLALWSILVLMCFIAGATAAMLAAAIRMQRRGKEV